MTIVYWAAEYGKVFAAYMFMMFIWPSVVFRKYLKGKSKTFWFGFCVTAQPLLVNTVVLCLGLVHLLYPFMAGILFYGTFLYCLVKSLPLNAHMAEKVHYLTNGTYGKKLFLWNVVSLLKKGMKACFRRLYGRVRGHIWEYGLLAIVVVYGMIYFTYGAFQDYSYGFGDMYPHNAWIYGLLQGQVFSAGVYPEGMHCFLYAMHVLFGIRVYSCLLFTAGIHVAILLLSAYIFLREVLCWKYSPILALTLFLTLEVVCIDEIYSMSRLQWTIPQEFALYTQFLCAAFLVKYVRKADGGRANKTRARFCWNEELVVFMLALSASIAIHFYATIMAFFLCVALVPMLFKRIFQVRRFVPLATGVVCGFLMAVLPMAGALASGIPFQGSIGWAMDVIHGTEGESGDEDGMEDYSENGGENGRADEALEGSLLPEAQEGALQNRRPPQQESSSQEEAQGLLERVSGFVAQKASILYEKSYVTLYKRTSGNVILGFTALAFLLWLACRGAALLLKYLLRKRRKIPADYFDGYFSIALASLLFMGMYCAGELGLPSLVAGSRLCSVAQTGSEAKHGTHCSMSDPVCVRRAV